MKKVFNVLITLFVFLFLFSVVLRANEDRREDPNSPYEGWIHVCVEKDEEITCFCDYAGSYKTFAQCTRGVRNQIKQYYPLFSPRYDSWSVIGGPERFCFGKGDRDPKFMHPLYEKCLKTRLSWTS